MKKIAHIQVIPKLSGVQQVSLDILSNINGYEKYIIFGGEYSPDELLLKKCIHNNIKVVYVKNLKREISIRDFNAFLELYKLFKIEKFDIVHTNSTKPGIVARIAARIAGVNRVVHTIHGISYHRFERIEKRLVYFIIEYFSSLFSHYLVSVNSYYLKYYPLIKNKTVIYNAIDSSQFNIKKERKYNNDVLKVGYLSRLDYQKDPLTLLKAIKIGMDRNCINNIRFIVGGDGELMDECLTYCKENDLLEVVDFQGWIENKSEFYSNIDVLCLPSIFEAFGLVFLEAGLHYVPSIATNVEGIPEVVLGQESGILVNPKDSNAILDAIMSYHNDRKLLRAHALKANEIAKDKFSLLNMVDSYKLIYEGGN
ncbi:glycosyltransferase [Vibrio vulnificus]|nr:glycosyltransferase [Vibrio vulnificus]EKO5199873.1 glycosyltransferase [Vibrio vulnificus]HAS8348796.1 glycosyltransferase family 1 protein [Vibrio vulnificus]HAS8510765.1 glycosyltransferase family 1 protein [Vibrio vulnificus]